MAIAEVVLHLIQALGSIRTGIGEAFVDVQLTILSLVTCATAIAPEATQLIDALASIQAGISHTVVYVDVTDASRHSRDAVAGEVVDLVDTGGAVRAGITSALIDVHFAVLALVSWLANAFVGIDLGGNNYVGVLKGGFQSKPKFKLIIYLLPKAKGLLYKNYT